MKGGQSCHCVRVALLVQIIFCVSAYKHFYEMSMVILFFNIMSGSDINQILKLSWLLKKKQYNLTMKVVNRLYKYIRACEQEKIVYINQFIVWT